MKTKTRETCAPYDFNTATLPEHETDNARNLSDKKETIDRYLVVAFDESKPAGEGRDDDRFVEAIDARFYMGRSGSASVIYCSVWIREHGGHQRSFTGRGSAGGGGYHKLSAALEDALTSAGVKLERSFGGCGEEAMRHALRAVARAAGYNGLPLTVIS